MPEETGTFLLVVSDLDGTLLDHHTYDATAARPALDALRNRHIPLVPCSSKTRREMRDLLRLLDIDGPYIAENGGAVVWPGRASTAPPLGAVANDGEWMLVLGAPRRRLEEAFEGMRHALGLNLVSLASLGVEEVAARTGLPRQAAGHARAREWSLPFFASPELSPQGERAVGEAAAAHGLTVTRGGRFHHLQGPAGKSDAVERVRRWFEAERGARAVLVVLGDAMNDAGMLATADIAIVVPSPDAGHTRQLRALVPHARLASREGPQGWNEAVLEVLSAEAASRAGS